MNKELIRLSRNKTPRKTAEMKLLTFVDNYALLNIAYARY